MEPEHGAPMEEEIPNLETMIFRFHVLGGVSWPFILQFFSLMMVSFSI